MGIHHGYTRLYTVIHELSLPTTLGQPNTSVLRLGSSCCMSIDTYICALYTKYTRIYVHYTLNCPVWALGGKFNAVA